MPRTALNAAPRPAPYEPRLRPRPHPRTSSGPRLRPRRTTSIKDHQENLGPGFVAIPRALRPLVENEVVVAPKVLASFNRHLREIPSFASVVATGSDFTNTLTTTSAVGSPVARSGFATRSRLEINALTNGLQMLSVVPTSQDELLDALEGFSFAGERLAAGNSSDDSGSETEIMRERLYLAR